MQPGAAEHSGAAHRAVIQSSNLCIERKFNSIKNKRFLGKKTKSDQKSKRLRRHENKLQTK